MGWEAQGNDCHNDWVSVPLQLPGVTTLPPYGSIRLKIEPLVRVDETQPEY